jgi:hypothetical protein
MITNFLNLRFTSSAARVGWLSTLALAAFLLAIKPAHGQVTTRTWQGAASAVWNTAGNWAGGVPDTNTEVASINGSLSGSSPVVLNTSPAISGLTIASGFTLTRTAADTTSRTITVSSATPANSVFNNAGTISSGGSSGDLRISIHFAAGTIVNSGTIEATAGSNLLLRSTGNATSGYTLTNTGGVLRTVGSGTLFFADFNGPVGVTGGSISNPTGTIRHRYTSTLTDVTFTNGGTFRSEAPTADSGVQYNIVLAGTSSLSNSGTMSFTKDVTGTNSTQGVSLQLNSATASLTNSGSVYFSTIGTGTSGFTAGTGLSVSVSSTLTNNGVMTFESRSDTNPTFFSVSAPQATLVGSGTLGLAIGTGGTASLVRITGSSGSELVNGASHTIRGAGAFGDLGLERFTNNGTLNADNATALTVALRSGSSGTFTNSSTGVVRASGAGGLVFSTNNQFTNQGLAQVDAGSVLALGTAIFSTPGHLKVNGSLTASSAISVAGLLSGTGTVVPAVAISGTLAPGNSIGTLSTGALILGGDSTFDIELGLQGLVPVSDRTAVTGGVTIDSGANLALTLYPGLSNPLAGDIFYIIDNDGADAISGIFTKLNGVTTTLTEGSQFSWNSQDWKITYQANVSGSLFTGGNDVAIMVAVPEPGAVALAAIGIAAAAMARRRLRCRVAE